nr:MAG TPA: hypothetical protein [Caudoviricetes sp.]
MYSFAMLICVNVVDVDTTGVYNVKHRNVTCYLTLIKGIRE